MHPFSTPENITKPQGFLMSLVGREWAKKIMNSVKEKLVDEELFEDADPFSCV